MSGTVEGGKKVAQIVKLRYGANYYQTIGRMGGMVKGNKGFATNRDLASEAGRKGGKVSPGGFSNRERARLAQAKSVEAKRNKRLEREVLEFEEVK